MFEKEAIRYAFEATIGIECLVKPVEDFTYEELSDEQKEKAYDFKEGAEFGYNKAMKEWRDCFMSCSSPYCADKFRDIQCDGMLGNMTKEVRDGSVE